MRKKLRFQALVQTREDEDSASFDLTFTDADGAEHTLTLSRTMVQELVPVLQSLSESRGPKRGTQLTKIPRRCAVGHAAHEQFVLIKFDDDPPYAIGLDDARSLWRDVRNESEHICQRRQPALH